MSVQHVFDSGIYTDVCSIHRWPDPVYRARPGTYMVIATLDVLRLVRMDKSHDGVFQHPVAVADDFGNLVGVPQ